jgi:outer membrane protein assembly factor BamA
MMTATARFLLVMFLILPAAVCSGWGQAAQTRAAPPLPDSARKLVAISVTGTKRYSPDEVIAASSLQIGAEVNDDDFKKASRRLGDTGAFTDIAYSYSYSAAGTKLELKLVDSDRFLPAHFEDFVWFTDEELRARIKAHVPLFNGELPVSGRLPDEVSDVLQAMLVEKGVPGYVNYVRTEGPSGKIEAFDYSVSEVLIRVRNIVFTGAGASALPALETAAGRIPDREYSLSRINAFVQRQLLPIYYARGYLKASFGPPQPTAVKEAPEESVDELKNLTMVDVTLAVSPGQQYKLTRLEWSGNREISTETLQSMVRFAPGQPANTVQLADNLAAVKTLYGSRGYINAAIKSEAEFDDAAGTVAIRLEVKEGYVFRMGELEFRGIDNSLTAKLRAAWKLRQGDVYDATYLKEYLAQANKLLPPALDWEVTPHATANVRDKTVDVDLQYSAKAPR